MAKRKGVLSFMLEWSSLFEFCWWLHVVSALLSFWMLTVLRHTLAFAWWGIDTIATVTNDSIVARINVVIVDDLDEYILALIRISSYLVYDISYIWFVSAGYYSFVKKLLLSIWSRIIRTRIQNNDIVCISIKIKGSSRRKYLSLRFHVTVALRLMIIRINWKPIYRNDG